MRISQGLSFACPSVAVSIGRWRNMILRRLAPLLVLLLPRELLLQEAVPNDSLPRIMLACYVKPETSQHEDMKKRICLHLTQPGIPKILRFFGFANDMICLSCPNRIHARVEQDPRKQRGPNSDQDTMLFNKPAWL